MEDVAAYRAFAQEQGLFPILAHAPYTLNACAADEGLRTFAKETMGGRPLPAGTSPREYVQLPPRQPRKAGGGSWHRPHRPGLKRGAAPEQSTTVLLETMAGKGSEVGRSFEELRAILDQVKLSDKLGVCLDTCHVSDGGYDLVNDLDGVLAEFDKVIGLSRLKAIHLNDSMNPLGSHKDRHQKLGEGTLGLEALTRIVNHPALRDPALLPGDPHDLAGYAREIALMKEVYRD